MPDFRAYVKEHLAALGVSGARQAEIIDELALDFEQRYENAIRGGLDLGEAWHSVRSQAQWPKLAQEFRALLRPAKPEPPKRSSMWNSGTTSVTPQGYFGRTPDSWQSPVYAGAMPGRQSDHLRRGGFHPAALPAFPACGSAGDRVS
jgi:hypothetical protein